MDSTTPEPKEPQGPWRWLMDSEEVSSSLLRSSIEDDPTVSGEAPRDLHTPGIIKHLSEAISKVH